MDVAALEAQAAELLREAGASFAFVHGSRSGAEGSPPPRPDSDLDIAAWWGPESSTPAPDSWEVPLPGPVDLLVLDTAPLWLAGRVALYGRLLFETDPIARVNWQVDVRLLYLDELPGMRERYAERRRALAARPLAGDRGRR